MFFLLHKRAVEHFMKIAEDDRRRSEDVLIIPQQMLL